MAQILIFSILISALYALVAIGFTMIFGVAGVLNLAHGAFIMAAAYVAYVANEYLDLNPILSYILAVLFTSALAVAIYKGLIRYVQRSLVVTMIVTLAFALILEQLVFNFRVTPGTLTPLIAGNTILFGVKVFNNQMLAFAISWVGLGFLWLFVNRSKMGKAIMATSMDRVGASLVGIDPEAIYTITWGISGALAGIAGIFFPSFMMMAPSMWRDPLIIAFAIVILGGLGSIRGSLIAAYMIGFIEILTMYTPWLGESWVGLPSLIILVVILVLRPRGLFGRKSR